jgi:catechol 2,3-dioxygenase-like lactoylglutathione lyase family enzyme
MSAVQDEVPGTEVAAQDVLAGMRCTVTLRVSDVSDSVAWYRRVFGCEPVFQNVDRNLDGQATDVAGFRLGGVVIWLSPLRPGQTRDPAENDRSPNLAFMTSRDLVPLRAELVARGALTRDDEPMHGFPAGADGVRRGLDAEFFYIYDLDCNRIEFCRPLPR